VENVISILYDIEEKANQIIKRANEEKISLQDGLKEDMKKLDQEIESCNKVQLDALKAQIDNELDCERKTLIEECNKQLSDIETNFMQNYDSLVTKILEGIINA
jgi:vacuolar-type H+-ATPase subunit H